MSSPHTNPHAPEEAVPFDESLDFRPPSARDKQLLFRQVLLGVGVALIAIGRSATDAESAAFFIGIAVSALSVLPLIIWAKNMDHNYPFFELFMATNLTSYGIPLMSETNVAALFGDEVRTNAGITVILFLIATLVAFYGVRGLPKRTAFWTKPVFRDVSPRWMIYGLIVSTIYMITVQFFWFPDPSIAGVLRAVFFGVGTSCTFIVGMAWGLNRLGQADKATVAICIIVQFFVTAVSLVLRTGVSVILIGVVGYFFGARRLPYLTVIVTLGVCAILNIGKYDLRGQYWGGAEKEPPTFAELPSFYMEWFEAGLNPQSRKEASAGGLLLERNSLLQMLCLVVSITPKERPYLLGETYQDIPGQFVPRTLWPDKPKGHISTYRLSIYYGLQDEEATGATTIAFGFLPEAYANFGYAGAIMLGALFGAVFKWIVAWSKDSPIFSYAGLLIILLTAWSFQTELTMSIWLTSLFQAAISIVAFVYLFRRGQEIMG